MTTHALKHLPWSFLFPGIVGIGAKNDRLVSSFVLDKPVIYSGNVWDKGVSARWKLAGRST